MGIKSLICKTGLHWEPVIEKAVFSQAVRCAHCKAWFEAAAGARVELERKWWKALEEDANKPETQLFDQDSPLPPDIA